MADIKFASGIWVNRHEKSPDFVIARISIAKEKFMQWLSTEEPDEKGYVKLEALRSKKGDKIYVKVDDYKKGDKAPAKDATEATVEYPEDDGLMAEGEIPF